MPIQISPNHTNFQGRDPGTLLVRGRGLCPSPHAFLSTLAFGTLQTPMAIASTLQISRLCP